MSNPVDGTIVVASNSTIPGRSDFEIERRHVLERLAQRYGGAGEPEKILDRVMAALSKHTPEGWRFTESPSSRFFVLDEESSAKFLGLSYRHSPQIAAVLQAIGEGWSDYPRVAARIDEFVATYVKEVKRIDLPILHHIRTVYPKREKAEIAEEKHIFERVRSEITHVVPLASRKIGNRPNAIVSADGVLWVRQHLNWTGVEPGGKEFYLFQPLTAVGVRKSSFRLYSYTENGDLRAVADCNFSCSGDCAGLGAIRCALQEMSGIRSDSYWKIPTNLDRRHIDLKYRLDHAPKECEPLESSEFVELHFLQEILMRARAKLHVK